MIFQLSPEQNQKLREWQKVQGPQYAGAIGGAYTFCFTPTDLGTIVEVICNTNNKKISLTDVSEW